MCFLFAVFKNYNKFKLISLGLSLQVIELLGKLLF
jgi:hypothetical protein